MVSDISIEQEEDSTNDHKGLLHHPGLLMINFGKVSFYNIIEFQLLEAVAQRCSVKRA